jgi:hypothetical protein
VTRMTRNVSLVLLGAAVLCSCCCCLAPPWRDRPDGSTESTSTTRSDRSSTYRRRSSWWPVFIGGTSRGGSYSPRPGGSSGPSRSGPVTRGGFGGSGRSFGGS